MEPLTLTTERLTLSIFTPDDTDAVLDACQDPEIQRWTTIPSPYARHHAEQFVGQLVPDGWRDDSAYAFAVRRGDDGPLMAAVSLHHPAAGSWRSATGRRRSTGATAT